MTSPNNHLHCLCKMVCTSDLLPPCNITNPSDKLLVQWLYMSYHHTDQQHFVKSGKHLKDKMLDTLTTYFQAIYKVQLANRSLKKNESQRESTKNQQADNESRRRHLSNEPGCSCPESSTHRGSGYCNDDRNRKSDRRMRHYEQHGRSSYDHHCNNSQARETSTTPKRVVDKPCPEHSWEGKPAQHTWAKCSLNKANKKPVVNRREHEAYTNNPCQLNNDKSYDDHSHHTPDVSGDDYSHHSEFSTDENYGVVYELMKFKAHRVGEHICQAKRPAL